MDDKKRLRLIYTDKRDGVSDKNTKDSIIAKKVLESTYIKNADSVLIYASFGSEISTFEIIQDLLNSGKTTALPKCSDNGMMTFHIIKSVSDLHPGKYGIPEPEATKPIIKITDNMVCIVPGLAFTEKGERLGYGGGYYDRFIAANPNIHTIGLTYEELIASTLPVMPHDLRVNKIATDERMVLCNAE